MVTIAIYWSKNLRFVGIYFSRNKINLFGLHNLDGSDSECWIFKKLLKNDYCIFNKNDKRTYFSSVSDKASAKSFGLGIDALSGSKCEAFIGLVINKPAEFTTKNRQIKFN